MKLFLAVAAAAAVLAAMPAEAISRYTSTSMSCAEAQSRVQAEGAVILRYSSARVPGLPLYDRYVANHTFCRPGEALKRNYIPTRDTNQCFVYSCAPTNYDDAWPSRD